MVLIRRPHQILLLVDPSQPLSWRQDPYYRQLKAWARAGVDARPRQQVLVYIKERIIAVLPNKEVDLGAIANEEHAGVRIMVRDLNTPRGRDWEAYVLPPDDSGARHAGRA